GARSETDGSDVKCRYFINGKGEIFMFSEERKKILKMLEDGKITVDEAERLLIALHENSKKDESADDQTGEESTALSEFVDWDRWDERKQTYKQHASGFKFSQ